jgi:hypothetical protein
MCWPISVPQLTLTKAAVMLVVGSLESAEMSHEARQRHRSFDVLVLDDFREDP